MEMLSAGNIPEDLRQRDFDALVERLNQTTDPQLSENDRNMCENAFASGLSAAIHHLLNVAHAEQVDLPLVIHQLLATWQGITG